jgi:nucleotide-binding universal stress UspA family protein
MTKILCAIDTTEHSKSAIDFAGKMAKAFDAELTIMVVNQLVGGYSRGGPIGMALTESEVSGALEEAVAEAKKAGAAHIRALGADSRDVAGAITIYAEDNGFDQIVVGTGEKGAVSRMVLGSVSSDVVHRAHCPVTVAR